MFPNETELQQLQTQQKWREIVNAAGAYGSYRGLWQAHVVFDLRPSTGTNSFLMLKCHGPPSHVWRCFNNSSWENADMNCSLMRCSLSGQMLPGIIGCPNGWRKTTRCERLLRLNIRTASDRNHQVGKIDQEDQGIVELVEQEARRSGHRRAVGRVISLTWIEWLVHIGARSTMWSLEAGTMAFGTSIHSPFCPILVRGYGWIWCIGLN